MHNDISSTFQELLQRNRSVNIHHKNTQTLTTEVHKAVNNIYHPIMKTFFEFRESRYKIGKLSEMRKQKIRTVRCGLETALYRASQLWSLVHAVLKSLPNINLFKSKIKHWKCTECPCKLCKTYLKNMLCLTFPQNQLNPVIKLWEKRALSFTSFSLSEFFVCCISK